MNLYSYTAGWRMGMIVTMVWLYEDLFPDKITIENVIMANCSQTAYLVSVVPRAIQIIK